MKRLAVFFILSLSSLSAHAEISESTFRKTLSEFETIYTNRLPKERMLTLASISGIWNPRSITAVSSARIFAEEQEARVQIDGDFARKPGSNRAAFVLIVCHEFGHIYMDRPKQLTLHKEGQADRFASECALDYFRNSEKDSSTEDVPAFLKTKCQSSSDEASCLQVASGINSFARVLQVDMTDLYGSEEKDFVAHPSLHPAPSCRVKTLIAGLFGQNMPNCTSTLRKNLGASTSFLLLLLPTSEILEFRHPQGVA